jgi:hypothetical protein
MFPSSMCASWKTNYEPSAALVTLPRITLAPLSLNIAHIEVRTHLAQPILGLKAFSLQELLVNCWSPRLGCLPCPGVSGAPGYQGDGLSPPDSSEVPNQPAGLPSPTKRREAGRKLAVTLRSVGSALCRRLQGQ